jgi:guanine nucleotide-binding protein alpha-1 subunit
MYNAHGLNKERTSWLTVIYFNVIHSIKHILHILETWDDSIDDTVDLKNPEVVNWYRSHMADSSSSYGSSRIDPISISKATISNLRRRLSPLVAVDSQLADRLSGGITVAGSGKGSVYVRSGWQARTIENALGRIRSARPSLDDKKNGYAGNPPDPLLQDIARMLSTCRPEVQELWAHPTVKGLLAKRRLKLDEWSEL